VLRSPGLPNGMRISCRPSSPRPHQPTFHSALEEGLPERSSVPDRPVGCMRGLGRAHAGATEHPTDTLGRLNGLIRPS
jgi:hypothetical protein